MSRYRLLCMSLLWARIVTAAADPKPPGAIHLAPVNAEMLLRYADSLDDTRAYIEQLIAGNVGCDKGLSWRGRGFIAVSSKMHETCGPWKAAESAWSRDQDWVLKNRDPIKGCDGSLGELPNWWPAYCTICPVPYSTTVDILRDQADGIRAMASVVACMSSRVSQVQADQQQVYQAELGHEREEAAKAQQARLEQEQREREARQKAENEHRAEENRKAQEEASRRAEEETERREAIARRYAEEKADADRMSAEQARSSAEYVGAMSSAGGGNAFEGTSFLFKLGVYFGADAAPVFEDSTGADIRSHSSTTSALGMGPGMLLELWPLYSKYVALGASGESSASYVPLPGGGSSVLRYAFGARAVVGKDTSVALLGRVGYGESTASIAKDSGGGIIDATSSGSGSSSGMYYGAGLRLCSKGDDTWCRTGWDFEAALWNSGSRSEAPVAFSVQRWSLRWSRGDWNFGAEFSPSYPRYGTPSFAGTTTDDSHGLLVHLFFGKSWDLFTRY